MTVKCNECGCKLNDSHRVRFTYLEGLHCPNCGNTVTVDELEKKYESELEE